MLIASPDPILTPAEQAAMQPGLLSKTQFLPVTHQGSWSALDVADGIFQASRSYRRDHCAIFADPDSADVLAGSGLSTSFLNPAENQHWTGLRRPKGSKLKQIVIGDYDEWFRWFMKWQRFNAFHIVVLISPVRRMMEDDRRGYFDGLLTRLFNRPSVHRIIVVEEEALQPAARRWMGGGPAEVGGELREKFGKEELIQAMSCLLYGTLLTKGKFSLAVASTVCSKVRPTWEAEFQEMKRRPSIVEPSHRRFVMAGYHAQERVESMETPNARSSLEDGQREIPALFRKAKDIGPSELSEEWLEGLSELLLESEGSFTVPRLYDYVNTEVQRVLQTSESEPKIFNDHFDPDKPFESHVFLPSRPFLRRIAETLAGQGRVQTATWVREIGRPTTVYYLPGRLPFLQANKCGQCAFYVPLRRQCRVWWLLNRSYGHRHPRWARDGERPLSAFELHKMKNSWRIGPRSSACLRFVDKKKDYTRKTFPKSCDICGGGLPTAPRSGQTAICVNCRTLYFASRQGRVRVLTGYEHEFRRTYTELASVDPSSDTKRLIEESQTSAPAIVEQAIFDERRRTLSDDPDSTPKTVMLFPKDRMLAREGRLYIFKRRSVESIPLAGSTIVDYGKVVGEEERTALESAGVRVWSAKPSAAPDGQKPPRTRYDIAPAVASLVASNPDFVRRMALAMARSAMHATVRVAAFVKVPNPEVRHFTARQELLIRRLEGAPPSRFLVYEAAVMKEYWSCYYLPLKGALQRSGPRKKARFVREYVSDPLGRARGYTAVDAAINYLHQRRLLKARMANMELGLAFSPGEGFLHRRKWNPEGLGLVLDLIDPFKFADRERLIRAVLDVSLNWRDFYGASDRRGARFYYPKPEAVGVLEAVGEAADRMAVSYGGIETTLAEAYSTMVAELIRNISEATPMSFAPFVF